MKHLIIDDEETLLLIDRSDQEALEFNLGFDAGSNGEEPNCSKSTTWQRGWAEAQE